MTKTSYEKSGTSRFIQTFGSGLVSGLGAATLGGETFNSKGEDTVIADTSVRMEFYQCDECLITEWTSNLFIKANETLPSCPRKFPTVCTGSMLPVEEEPLETCQYCYDCKYDYDSDCDCSQERRCGEVVQYCLGHGELA